MLYKRNPQLNRNGELIRDRLHHQHFFIFPVAPCQIVLDDQHSDYAVLYFVNINHKIS